MVGWEERACELTNPAPVRADLASTPHPEQSSDRALLVWGRQAGLGCLLASLALGVAYSNHCCEKKQKHGRGVYFGARFKKASAYIMVGQGCGQLVTGGQALRQQGDVYCYSAHVPFFSPAPQPRAWCHS